MNPHGHNEREQRQGAKQHNYSQPYKQQRLVVVPCTIDQANTFVKRQHRHHGPLPGARIAFAVADEYGLVHGVALVGRPLSRHLDDNWTLEVTRMCTDGCPNACSFLYGAAWKAVRAIGYRRLITYTLPEEGGASLRAVGWKPVPGCGGGSWNRQKRERKSDPLFLVQKTRWEIATPDFLSTPKVIFPNSECNGHKQTTLPTFD